MTRSRLFFGVTFLAIGALLFADRAGVVDAGSAVRDWWPLLVMLAGVVRFLAHPRALGAGLGFLLVGAVLLLATHGFVEFGVVVWPVVLIAFGLALLFRSRDAVVDVPVTREGDVTVVFGERRVRLPDGPMRLRAVTAVFGDVDVDLTASQLGEHRSVKVVAIAGDVDLDVPADWQVVLDGPEILSSVRMDALEPAPGGPQVRIDVVAILADVSVRHRSRSAPTG